MYRLFAVVSVVLLVGLAGCGGPGPGAETDDGLEDTPTEGEMIETTEEGGMTDTEMMETTTETGMTVTVTE